MKVLLIGSYPPPLGGVSVFVRRYGRRLESEGREADFIDPQRLSKAGLFARLVGARFGAYDLVSLNFPSIHIMALLLALGRAGRAEVWDHNWRALEEWGGRRRRLYGAFLRRCRGLFLIAPHLAEYCREHGVELPAKELINMDGQDQDK